MGKNEWNETCEKVQRGEMRDRRSGNGPATAEHDAYHWVNIEGRGSTVERVAAQFPRQTGSEPTNGEALVILMHSLRKNDDDIGRMGTRRKEKVTSQLAKGNRQSWKVTAR